MSMMTPMGGGVDVGERVATFTEYTAAQKAVSALIAAEIPAREISIVGRGLRSIERVTGKLGYAVAARQGALNGIMLGVLFAAIFVLGAPDAGIQMFFGVMLVGIALGMLMSIISYAVVSRRRDYASVMQVAADHYDVMVQATSIHKARGVLGTAPTGAAHRPAAPAPASTEPPRYGVRVDPAAGPVQPAQPAQPATPPKSVNDPSEPPRYGERVSTAQTPAVAPPAVPVAPVAPPAVPASQPVVSPEQAAPESDQPDAPRRDDA